MISESIRPECVEALHYPYNQGSCGSCYAFSVQLQLRQDFATLAIIYSQRLAVKDALECGTQWHGHSCISLVVRVLLIMQMVGDGGIYLVYHYAADHGLVEGVIDIIPKAIHWTIWSRNQRNAFSEAAKTAQ